MLRTNTDKAGTLRRYLYTIAGLTVLLLVLSIAGNYPSFIETAYSRGLYVAISVVLHFCLGWLPVSVGDLFYIFVIIYALYLLGKILRQLFKKKFKKAGLITLKFIIGLQIFIAAFYVLWGCNYSRPPAARILNLPDSTYTTPELIKVTKLLIDSTNRMRAKLKPQQLNIGNADVYTTATEAIKQAGTLYPQLRNYSPSIKSSLFTPVINYLGTAGYFNPFSGEAQINYGMPLVNRPVSACHEMAHQMGFAREDEANFVGYIAGIHSKDTLLRYSAYYLGMQEFMHQLYRRDSVTFKALKLRISPLVRADIKADKAYWLHYQNQISNISGVFYDQFLKANKQPEGLRTYNRMIVLTMGYYRGRKVN